jgi:signal transduction histidine kinase
VRLDRFMETLQLRARPSPAAGVVLDWQIAPDLPLVETDPEKLSTILDNLINNAIKFTDSGRITVRVNDAPGAECVELRIEDTGPGIPEEYLPSIFEPFRQVDGTPSRRHGGAGLGLAIVHRYVGLLGGRIEVHSRLGVGSAFVVSLPYGAPAAARTAAHSNGAAPIEEVSAAVP